MNLADISGHTMPFAVLGHPIGHTLSPVMHNASIAAMNLDAVYLAFDVHPDMLMQVLPAMARMGFKGVNLTIPLKEIAFRNLASLDSSAATLGAVNTVEFREDGSLRGHNTDGKGFIDAIKEAFQVTMEGRSVMLIGSGGAGRAVALASAMAGAGKITLADADNAKASAVETEALSMGFPVENIGPDRKKWIDAALAADIIVQATPAGMKLGDKSPLSGDAFREGHMAFDLVYMYPETDFMRLAAAKGARSANGLDMLLYQGVEAFVIWTGLMPAVEVMREALKKRVYGNIKET